MKDKIYPAIYKAVDGNIYTYLDAENYYSHERECWDVSYGDDSHSTDKNITREYLQNTCGEVASPEHAEFIIELAKANNIEVRKSFGDGLFFNFYTDPNGELYLGFFDRHLANDSNERQITIPLPPKQIQTATPEEEFQMKKIMKNAGDNLVLGCEDSKCDKWPRVGDEVLIYSKFRRLAEIKGKAVKVIGKCTHSDGDTILTVEHSSLGVFAVAEGLWVKKPKTPEEELRDDIIEVVWRANDLWTSTKEVQQVSVQEFVATKIIEKYNITKKPQ